MARKKTIGKLVKSQRFWGVSGALCQAFRSWVRLVAHKDSRPEANSMLASVCYTIANNYGGKGTKSGKAIGGVFLGDAYFLSWMVERELGLPRMTSGQLSVWVNIRYAWGRARGSARAYEWAMRGIRIGLSSEEIPPNDRALFLIKKGLIHDVWDEAEQAKEAYARALEIVDEDVPHAPRISALDRVRVWRDYAESRLERNQILEAFTFLTKARRLAVENNLTDQVTKIDQLMRRYKVPLI